MLPIPRRALVILMFVTGAAIALSYMKSLPESRPRTVDLAVEVLGIEVRPDRRMEITLHVANRAGPPSGPSTLTLASGWGTHEAGIDPLRPGEGRVWSWTSPPVLPGDHSLAVSIGTDPALLDADESNNVAARIVGVPEAHESRRHRLVLVPDVIGSSRAAAGRTLRAAGLAAPRWYEHALHANQDRVERQWPEPDRTVPVGTKPVLVAAAVTPVPNVTLLTLERARALLNDAGLEVGRLEVVRSIHEGTRRVVAQNPAPGIKAALRTGVQLRVVDPLPLWPLVIGGLMVVIALVLGVVPESRTFALATPAGSQHRLGTGGRARWRLHGRRQGRGPVAIESTAPAEPEPATLEDGPSAPTAVHGEADDVGTPPDEPWPLADWERTPATAEHHPLGRVGDEPMGGMPPLAPWPYATWEPSSATPPLRGQPAADDGPEPFQPTEPSVAIEDALAMTPLATPPDPPRFDGVWDPGAQRVAWFPETDPETLTFVPLRDAGNATVTWGADPDGDDDASRSDS